MPAPTAWPRAINTLLPHHLTRLASELPHATYARIPNSPVDLDLGYREVTYRDLNSAVNTFSSWIARTIGVPEKDGEFPTLVYMGPNDIRYEIMLLGAVKVGYKMLFPTPQYGAEGLSFLISRVEARIMLVPSAPLPIVTPVLAIRPDMDVYEVPELGDLLTSSEPPAEYPYTKTWEEAKNEPLVVLHTSGTTGFPKPIIWTHDWADSIARGKYLEVPAGYENMNGLLSGSEAKMLTMMPAFHASGFFGGLFFPLLTGTVLILPPSGLPPSASLVADITRHADVSIVAMPPPYIEKLGSSPAVLQEISSKAKAAFWIGGDVSHAAGEAISAQMQLYTDLGSTEMGLFPIIRKQGPWRKSEWHYMRFHPELNMQFQYASSARSSSPLSSERIKDEDIYEAVIVRNRSWEQPIFKLFPDLAEYRTGDLFLQHPTEEGLWRHYGRADDLLVFASGEKFHPSAAEKRIEGYADIAEAMLVGTCRPKAALLLRLKNGMAGKAEMDDAWPAIEQVNKSLPVYARIGRDMLLAVNKEFLKTAKGTVRRKAMIEVYERELDELYANSSSG